MNKVRALLSPVLVIATLAAQEAGTPNGGERFSVQGTATRVKIIPSGARLEASLSRDGGRTWQPLLDVEHELALRYGTFDPLAAPPAIPPRLLARAGGRLFLVQFKSQILEEFKAGLLRLGAEIHHYVPNQALLVRVDPSRRDAIGRLPYVRWIGPLHPAFRLEEGIIHDLLGGNELVSARYNVVLVDRLRDERPLTATIERLGGRVVNSAKGGNILLEAMLDGAQLLQLLREDTVLWIDRWSEPERDIDNARIQAGVNFLQSISGIDGKGMSGMVLEGIFATHPEFGAQAPYRTAPLWIDNATASGHGTSTAGEIYAQGRRAQAKGLMPFAQLTYANLRSVFNNNNRFNQTKTVTNPTGKYKVMFQTASWGYSRTTQYTSRSAEMDRIIFAHDKLLVTNSQSNAGATSNPRMSRPQAWAKNIIGVGGFRHFNNANPNDDCWCRSGSTGPAADGRIGVTFAAYYDSILTTSGSSSYTSGFGGTSGATPIVNGLAGLTIQMFTEGLFGYPKAPTFRDRIKFLPHFTTTKAIMVANSRQLPLNRATRVQQGFGLPNVEDTWRNRNNMLVIDEEDSLKTGEQRTYWVWVKPGTKEFRAAMSHKETEAAAFATIHRINSVDLRVTNPSGAKYWGNNGLMTNLNSSSGGVPNDRDTIEAVILSSPAAGAYAVEVRAAAVRKDADPRSPATDVTFGLAVRGIGGDRDKSGMLLDLISTAKGDFRVSLSRLPATWVAGYTFFSLDTRRFSGLGDVFGLETDGLTLQIAGIAPRVGNVFAFTKSPNRVYPNTTFKFPLGVALAVSGRTFDGVVMLVDASGNAVAVSNVDRLKVQ